MPELPEVEAARAVVAQQALGRRVVDAADGDSYVCRPHAPGELRDALVGRRLTAAHRRGKTMWCETSGVGRSRRAGPLLGLHLGMAGRIVVTDAEGTAEEGGDRPSGARRRPEWDRFWLTFADGGHLVLVDKRRLGRVRLDPDVDALGPDAGDVGLPEFRALLGRGRAPVKARLLDQAALAGVGNLLADETLWQARLDPRRRVDELTRAEVAALHRALRRVVRAAVRAGGVHAGEVVGQRRPDGHCPRCGTPMARATVGSRTTWRCPRCQE